MKSIVIAALGVPGQTSAKVLNAVANAQHLFLQTDQHPCAQIVQGLSYTTMDDLYTSSEDFDILHQQIAQRLTSVDRAVYAVPGSGCKMQLPFIREAARATGHEIVVLPGIGYAQAASAAIPEWDQSGACVTCAATAIPANIDPSIALCIEEIDTRMRAGEVKLLLQEYYTDEWDVYLAWIDASGEYCAKKIALYELDRQSQFGATTVLLVPPATMFERTRYSYADLEEVMRRLRAPDGCPWDHKQTHLTLKKPMIEECYEVLDAIDREDPDALCEELGDVLLQCVFHAQIATEHADFTARDMTTGIVGKLIYRHPHVFSTAHADSSEAVLVQWEQLKKKEKHFETQADVLHAVPRNLPALMRSSKIQNKAAQVGFDWDSAQDAMFKIPEELEELQQALAQNENVAEEMGDLLFAVVNVARLLNLEAELVLGKATDKFERRFAAMEALALSQGKQLNQMTLEEQDALWNIVKNAEKRQL